MNAKPGAMDDATPAAPESITPARTEPAARSPRARRRRALILSVPLVLALAGGAAWLLGGRYVTTDNAYVHQRMISVSPDVSGRITEVLVTENQTVPAGTPLFRLDDSGYRIALDSAEAQLAAARLSVAQLRAAYQTAAAQLDAAEAIKDVQQRELERQQELTARGVGSQASLDDATLANRSAANAVAVAQRQLNAAAAALGGDPEAETDTLPAVRTALSAREAAARDLAHTEIAAQTSGTVSQIESLNIGQFVAAGTGVATLVDGSDSWIEANFKETQLAALTEGQPVTIGIDAYPDADLHGEVESFGSATGSQFSLIPAQNATGNWVKVVQRVPVRIRIDDASATRLRDGMSVHVSVDTGHSRLDNLR
ncbi:membrane protein [Primorskyibacter flagellatus]|uniref:Membrane protein n=1 Tax=Primorskyibacter flagellatus TaxID=1387277 RepID=A0A917ABI2_9RHOB|nr:HlyD family secretion protein [Primorskyibacter flagellatus]GGE41333.1 membrane protein [Primorskyibacter flagellatus]